MTVSFPRWLYPKRFPVSILIFLFLFLLWVFIHRNFRGKLVEVPLSLSWLHKLSWKRTQDTTGAINAVTPVMLLKSLRLKKSIDALYSNLQFCDSHL